MNGIPNLLEVQWYQVLAIMLPTGIGGIILGILAWIRFAPKDKADVRSTEGDVEVKSATAEKIKAEANQLTKQTEINVADAALKIADSVRVQLIEKEKELEKTQDELNDLRKVQFELNQKNLEINNRCEKLQKDLDKEKELNRDLITEVEQLKLQLEQLRRSQGGRPN